MATVSSADLLLHPIRLRIIQTFLGDRRLTTGQLRLEIADVAPATLYRQVATLAQAGVLTVVDERRVRGTVERTYALSIADAELSDDELIRMTPDDHRRCQDRPTRRRQGQRSGQRDDRRASRRSSPRG